MFLTRRAFGFGLTATVLTGCGPAPRAGTSSVSIWRAAPNPGFDAWIQGFRGRALAAGISGNTVAAGLRGVGYLPTVVERDRNQTEFKRSLEDYLAIAASQERVATGRTKLREFASTLAAIERRHGVEARVICAIWGLESRYGARRGDVPVISALATLAYDGRRGAFFEKQLIAALKIIQRGDITTDRMRGSWAGAMGHTQFIPTSYQAFAVDFTGDGKRDIWSDDPTDALASAAAYLSRNGWQRGKPWGGEVRLPASYSGPYGRAARQSITSLRQAGVTLANGNPLPQSLGSAGILIPAGRSGPAFAVSSNFGVILRYNNAENYAIGIGHLSDRIAGGGAIRGDFGPDAYGLTLPERKDLQRGLNRAGFDVGDADGVLGRKTEAAIRAYQRASGLAETGKPSPALLARLR
ncbi:MAG: lytic murein transglycosylase [Paracoccaceae bacterium]